MNRSYTQIGPLSVSNELVEHLDREVAEYNAKPETLKRIKRADVVRSALEDRYRES